MTLSPQMAMTIDTDKLLSVPSGYLTPLPPSVNLQQPAKFERSSSQEDDASTPKLHPGGWNELASGDLHEKLSSLAAKQWSQEALDLPKPTFADDFVKVPLDEQSFISPPPAPHAVARESKRNRLAVISKGSVGHPYNCAAACKYVKRKGGCRDGADCPNCHECFWSKATAKEAETRNDAQMVQQDEQLAEKVMRLLQDEHGKVDMNAQISQVPPMGFVDWSSSLNYMGVKIPGETFGGIGPLVSEPVPTADNPGSKGHPYSCGPACKYVQKSRGCKDGDLCTHCHLCRWTRYASKHHLKI
ncbi:unnamed protein product [Durusdinium trenchii]|uniref:C3H1-type domain-containing protein n=1 Tax=Durusdinium trenchii TaxID=1381693 RepID=A0ABP0LXQ8_9DINO